MTYNRSLILFSAFVAFGMTCFVIVRLGFYPVAMVNFNVITAAEMEKNAVATENYFRNLSLLYGSDSDAMDKEESRKEIRRAALDKLISEVLIYEELSGRVENFQLIAENKIREALNEKEKLDDGIKKLYGLTILEFKNQVLLPQAYQEILEGRLFLKNENFKAWLDDSRVKARIFILVPDLMWSDKLIKLRN